MYSTIFEGKKISIRNYHIKKLLERFDPDKFEMVSHKDGVSAPVMENKVPCALCKSFNPKGTNCDKCPLAKFKAGIFTGCGNIFRILIPGPIMLRTYVGSVVYNVSNEERVLKDLKTITKFLKSFNKE